MKKIIIISVLLISFFGCKKENTDLRDQFVGSWKGSQTINVPSLSFNSTDAVTQIITKNSSNNKISITGGGTTSTATVNGNTYIYDKFTETDNSSGITMVIEYTGNGSVNGNSLNESGVIKISANGNTYTGTWSGNYTKQ